MLYAHLVVNRLTWSVNRGSLSIAVSPGLRGEPGWWMGGKGTRCLCMQKNHAQTSFACTRILCMPKNLDKQIKIEQVGCLFLLSGICGTQNWKWCVCIAKSVYVCVFRRMSLEIMKIYGFWKHEKDTRQNSTQHTLFNSSPSLFWISFGTNAMIGKVPTNIKNLDYCAVPA